MENRSSEYEQMSVAAQNILREYAGLRWPTLNHKGRVTRLASALGFGCRRAKAIYHNETGVRLRADELAAIEALRSKRADNAVRASQENYRLLEARIAALEALYERVDPEHAGEFLAAFRSQARGEGGGFGQGGAGNGLARDGADPADFSD